MRASEKIPADRRTRRKLDWEDTRRPAWVMWLSVACLVVLVAVVIALSTSDRVSGPQAVNGDSLGITTGEEVPAYVDRARGSLDAMTGDVPRWALVTPDHPATVDDLTAVFSPLPDIRVSTLLAGGTQQAVPEPAAGHQRADVFATARERAAAGAGAPVDDPALDVLGVVVHAAPADLTTLAHTPGVLAVEAAPQDAVFGRIGFRPVAPAEAPREDRQEVPAP
jgi:hypothetical protein